LISTDFIDPLGATRTSALTVPDVHGTSHVGILWSYPDHNFALAFNLFLIEEALGN
jgi:hypothetical protein